MVLERRLRTKKEGKEEEGREGSGEGKRRRKVRSTNPFDDDYDDDIDNAEEDNDDKDEGNDNTKECCPIAQRRWGRLMGEGVPLSTGSNFSEIRLVVAAIGG